MTSGAEAFANSVASGVEGVFVSISTGAFLTFLLIFYTQTKPLEGADAEGASGFFRGLGKGLVGCVFLSQNIGS